MNPSFPSTYIIIEVSLSLSLGVRSGLSAASWKAEKRDPWQYNVLLFRDCLYSDIETIIPKP